MPTFYLHSEDEHASLCVWIERDDCEWGWDETAPAGERGVPPAAMNAAAQWLALLPSGPYPMRVPLPPEHFEPLQMVIDDWGEVLSNYPSEDDDGFQSDVLLGE